MTNTYKDTLYYEEKFEKLLGFLEIANISSSDFNINYIASSDVTSFESEFSRDLYGQPTIRRRCHSWLLWQNKENFSEMFQV